jgi:hypothetical protein
MQPCGGTIIIEIHLGSSASALLLPYEFAGRQALSLEISRVRLTPSASAACRTLLVPSTFVLMSSRGIIGGRVYPLERRGMDDLVHPVERELEAGEIADVPEHELEPGIREPLPHFGLLQLVAGEDDQVRDVFPREPGLDERLEYR